MTILSAKLQKAGLGAWNNTASGKPIRGGATAKVAQFERERRPMRHRMTSAGVAMVGFLALTASAKAEWACEVALCLSNPAGPMAVGECVPPISKLYEHLAKGRAFPLCQSADGHVNFTRYGMERWERCSDGSRARERVDPDSGRPNGGVCNVFVPGGAGGPRQTDDSRVFETRRIDGEMVWGEVVEEDAAPRSRPRFLDYVVQGQSQRVWF